MDTDVFREVFQQPVLLRQFLAGQSPSVNDLIDGLFLSARSRDPMKPDYIYRNARDLATTTATTDDVWKTWSDAVLGTLEGIASRFLEPSARRQFTVRYDRFAEWQHLIPETSPLAVVSTKIGQRYPVPTSAGGILPAETYIRECVIPQIRYSAIPTVHEPRIDRIIDCFGLDDLHVHLNGTSETEVVWLNALLRPHEFAKTFGVGRKKQEIRDFLNQIEAGLTHDGVLQRLRVAIKIRRRLAQLVLGPYVNDHAAHETPLPQVVSTLSLLTEPISEKDRWTYRTGVHPVEAMFMPYLTDANHTGRRRDNSGREYLPPLSMEAFLLIATLDAIRRRNNGDIAPLLFVYLSLMIQFGRLIVQSRYQVGFDQFQKITVSEIREEIEKRTYGPRLRQVQFSERGDIDLMEGRIAPKSTPKGNLDLLRILDGDFQAYVREARSRRPQQIRPLDLRVVMHFIKRHDNRVEHACGHYRLRKEIAKQRRALLAALTSCQWHRLSFDIVGFDAASNELHAPPEVFAPLFRSLRRDGACNFTYHVGEDFVHLASGIRSVHEAIDFLELTPGNRLAHCTAIGVCPELWRRRMGDVSVLKKGEWLDTLVFSHGELARSGKYDLALELERSISKLSNDIYKQGHSPELLYRAWTLRRLDALVACEYMGCSEEALDNGLRAEFKLCEEEERRDTRAFAIFKRYHRHDVIKESRRLIEVGTDEWPDPFTAEALIALQERVMSHIQMRRLVIETLPTSNVRIHIYKDFDEHHLFRWLGLTGSPLPRVPIVVGTDDPGIFATCIRNEYIHVLRELDKLSKANANQSEGILQVLIDNGKTWRFRGSQFADYRCQDTG